jgi:glycine dehydrogenase
MASFYAVYHGPKGLKLIAERTHGLTISAGASLEKIGYKQSANSYFDTIRWILGDLVGAIHRECVDNELNLNYNGNVVTIALDETTSLAEDKDY